MGQISAQQGERQCSELPKYKSYKERSFVNTNQNGRHLYCPLLSTFIFTFYLMYQFYYQLILKKHSLLASVTNFDPTVRIIHWAWTLWWWISIYNTVLNISHKAHLIFINVFFQHSIFSRHIEIRENWHLLLEKYFLALISIFLIV